MIFILVGWRGLPWWLRWWRICIQCRRPGLWSKGMAYVVMWKSLSCIQLFATPWNSPWNSPGQNTGVGSHSLLHGDLPNPGIEPGSAALPVDSFPAEPPGKAKRMATHPSILAWRIPWMEEPGRLQSMGLQRVRHDWATNYNYADCST